MLQKRAPRPAAKRGFSMVEVVIVLGIFAFIIGGIWALVKTVVQYQKEHQARLEIGTIVGNFRQLYSRVGALSGTTYTTAMDQQDAVPTEMRVNPTLKNGLLNHPWGNSATGTVEIRNGGAPVGETENTLVNIRFNDMPAKACRNLSVTIGSGEIPGLQYVRINSTAYGTVSGTAGVLPVTLTAADIACNNADSNTLDMVFKLR